MMDAYEKKYVELLRANGLSVTEPRKVVFEILYSFGLQSVNQIIQRSASIDRASVYRTIKLLETIGAVNRVPFGFKYKLELSEIFLPHHHHIQCSKCGRQSDIKQEKLEDLLKEMAQTENFILTSHKIELVGLCNRCQN